MRAPDGQLGRGEVLDRDAERAEHGQRPRTAAARVHARCHVAELGEDVLGAADRALGEREPVVAGLGLRRLARVDEQLRGRDRRDVELTRRRDARPDRIDMCARGEPRALEHGLGRVGGGDDDVGAVERLARARRHLEAHGATPVLRGRLLGEPPRVCRGS